MPPKTSKTSSTVTTLVMGTRLDHVPAPETHKLFITLCIQCRMETATEIEYPEDVTLVCNVCAPAVTEQLLQEQQAQLAFDLPADAKARMMDAAIRLAIPYEELVLRFAAWRTGEVMEGTVSTPHEKKQEEKS